MASSSRQSLLRAPCHTRNVVADMGHDLRAGLKREHSVERCHAMNFGGCDVQSQRDVVESARADPADAVLDRMERG